MFELFFVLAYVGIVGFGGWPLVRGTGPGWQLLVWLILLCGPGGAVLWLLMRRGARMGFEHANESRPDPRDRGDERRRYES